MQRGKCRQACYPPELFFPAHGEIEQLEAAIAVCEDGCEVRVDCLEFALVHNLYGVWGATSQRARRKMKARTA